MPVCLSIVYRDTSVFVRPESTVRVIVPSLAPFYEPVKAALGIINY